MDESLTTMAETSLDGIVPEKDHELIQRARSAGHPTRKWHELMAQYMPEAFGDWVEATIHLDDPKHIDRKTREFIIVAIDACEAWPHISNHINKAFDAGASVEELVEVCVTAGHIMGPHAWGYGLAALADVIKARRAKGVPVPEGAK